MSHPNKKNNNNHRSNSKLSMITMNGQINPSIEASKGGSEIVGCTSENGSLREGSRIVGCMGKHLEWHVL